MSEVKDQDKQNGTPEHQPNPAFVHSNGEPAGKDSDSQKPRSSSFKDSDKYVRTGSGTFVRQVSIMDDVPVAVEKQQQQQSV